MAPLEAANALHAELGHFPWVHSIGVGSDAKGLYLCVYVKRRPKGGFVWHPDQFHECRVFMRVIGDVRPAGE